MSDVVQIALITSLSSAIPAITAAYFAYKSSQHSKSAIAIAQKTEENTNHMKDELVALTKKSAHAEGVLEGKAISGNE